MYEFFSYLRCIIRINLHEASESPFVRWWWNGDKVEADELVRELRLLKDAVFERK